MTKSLTAALFGLGLLASSTALAGEKTVTLTVQNMYCSACPITVKSSLEAVPGVAEAVVSYENKTAVVTF
jgi:mercuric ion binding protein